MRTDIGTCVADQSLVQNANIDWSLLTKPSAIGPSFLLINGTFTTLRDSLKSDCYCKMHTYLQNRDFERVQRVRVQRDSANWNDNGARVACGGWLADVG